MTMTNETYKAMCKRHDEERHAYKQGTESLMFYVFNDQQLKDGLDAYHRAGGKDEDLVRGFGGLIGQEKAVDGMYDLWTKQAKERRVAIKSNREFAIAAFKSEMNNLEYGWSEDDEAVLEAFGFAMNDLQGDLGDWYEEARSAYMAAVEDYVW